MATRAERAQVPRLVARATEERLANLERLLDAATTLVLEAGQVLLEEWRVATIRSLRIEE
jgi:hypothetical protein